MVRPRQNNYYVHRIPKKNENQFLAYRRPVSESFGQANASMYSCMPTYSVPMAPSLTLWELTIDATCDTRSMASAFGRKYVRASSLEIIFWYCKILPAPKRTPSSTATWKNMQRRLNRNSDRWGCSCFQGEQAGPEPLPHNTTETNETAVQYVVLLPKQKNQGDARIGFPIARYASP